MTSRFDQPAAIKATYSDWKTVKTRKTLQLIFEVPLEAQEEVLRMLGAPMPDREIWVGIARLRDAEPEAEAPREAKPLAQIAGILCNETGFQTFLAEKTGILLTAEAAADEVRNLCGVKSRADLDHDPEAARKFLDLRADYKLWLSGVAA